MTNRSRVRPKPLPTPRATDPGLGLPYEQLATETLDEMRARLDCEQPDYADYQPEVFASPADMYAWLTRFPADSWQDFIGYMEWLDRQQREVAGPEVTQAITAVVVPDRYAALADLAPSDTVILGEVVDDETPQLRDAAGHP